MIKTILIAFFAALFFNQSIAQLDSTSCVKEILNFNKKMVEIGKPKNGKVYAMDYRQEISYWDSETSPVDMTIKYYVSTNKVNTISAEMKTYMDEKYVFTVLEKEKKIILTLNPHKEADPTSMEKFLKNQEVIIKKCGFQECSIDKGKGIKKIVLNARKVGVKGFEADKLVYYFKVGNGKLLKTITSYTRNYPIRRMSITINEINFNSSYKFPDNLYAMFLDTNGKLKPKYKGYQLITE